MKKNLKKQTHVGISHNTRRVAFTLAEVLITLGIIGVVSAMTIPTLVANYNAKQWNTAATVFDRKLEEALKTMNTQSTLAGHVTTESFVEELSKHFKTNKICSNDKLLDCFSETIYWGGGEATPEEVDISKMKTATSFGQKDWGTNIVGVQFANGTSALIAYNPTSGENSCTQDPYSNQIKGRDCLAILYDTSGEKNPNTSGKDLRANSNVTNLGGCLFEIGGTCYTTTPFPAEAHVWNACNTNGSSTNPDDVAFMKAYGINYCLSPSYGSNDYWAGAVKACGGVSKMPTLNQLAELANYAYDRNDIGAKTDKENISRKDAKLASLGFTFPQDAEYYIWSGQEYSTYRSFVRGFSPTKTIWAYSRYKGMHYAICIDN